MHRTIASVFLLSSPLLAQVTSPKGLDTAEGNMVFYHYGPNRRVQQIDNSHTGRPLIVKSFGARRDGNVAQGAPARMLDLTLDMGLCDFGNVSQDFDSNFLPSSRKSVVPLTRVSFPDWSAAVPGPAPFDFKVPFPAPFIYIGQSALVIDLTIQNSTVTSLAASDREYNSPGGGLTGTAGIPIGTGCVSTGQTATFDHKTSFMNQGAFPDPRYALRFRVAGTYAPASSGVLLFIDTMDRNISGVVCTVVHALPILSIPLTANAAGSIPETFLGFPYDAALESATIYSQLLAIDVGQPGVPVTMSNGARTTIPTFTGANSHPCTYSWYTLPFTANSIVFFGGGLVFELG